jgi:hypothetical protein
MQLLRSVAVHPEATGGGADGDNGAAAADSARAVNASHRTLNACVFGKPCINGSVWPPEAVSGRGAVAKVINETQDFFVHGVKPHGALDAVDLLLMRKMRLLDACHGSNRSEGTADGPGYFVHTRDYSLARAALSDKLMCAMRIHLANETEMDALCPQVRPPPPPPPPPPSQSEWPSACRSCARRYGLPPYH